MTEQQNTATNTRLADNAFLLKFPHSNRNCADTFLRSFLYVAPYKWNKLDEHVRRLTDFNMFKSEIKTVLFLRCFDNSHDIVIHGL